MYNFCTCMLVLIGVGYGFFMISGDGFIGKLLGFLLACLAVGFYFRWESRLFNK